MEEKEKRKEMNDLVVLIKQIKKKIDNMKSYNEFQIILIKTQNGSFLMFL